MRCIRPGGVALAMGGGWGWGLAVRWGGKAVSERNLSVFTVCLIKHFKCCLLFNSFHCHLSYICKNITVVQKRDNFFFNLFEIIMWAKRNI